MEEGAPSVEGGRTKCEEKSAKCVGVGCHLSQHSHNSPLVKFEGVWGCQEVGCPSWECATSQEVRTPLLAHA
jgi:hypothetical protein